MFRNFRFSAPMLLLAALLAVSSASCRTAQKYVESGDYDAAIDFCVHKLQGRKKKKEEYVRGLEAAFQKAQARDFGRIERFDAENRPENWARVHEIHRQIRARQAKVEPLTPLRASNGYVADFEFVNIEKLENGSRTRAAEFLYQHAENNLRRAETGDKMAAREAYETLRDLESRYFRTFRDKDVLLQKARQLGTSHILFEVKNQTDRLLPRGFAERAMAMSKGELDSEWKSFHFEARPGVAFDYRAVFKVREVAISPERIRERQYTDEKSIQDGWTYLLDAHGKVKKDSLGRDIKSPRLARVRADVLEVFQTKSARLGGSLEIMDARTGALLDVENRSAEVVFEHCAATFKGDERALSDDSRCHIGTRPAPFPLDEDLLLQTADRLKPALREAMRSSRAIL